MTACAVHIDRCIFQRVLLAALLWVASGHAVAQVATDNQVKAVFIYNFTKFIEWPESRFENSKAPFVIAIVGPDPFGTFIDEIVRNEKVAGHSIQVKRYRHADDVHGCHIAFLHLTHNIREAILMLQGRGMLTVSGYPGFASIGGMVGFFSDNRTIKLEVNPAAIKSEGLAVSSKLLRIAKIYE